MNASKDYPIEVALVDAQGQVLDRAPHDADTTVGELIARARRASAALGEGELLATWQAHPLAAQMTLIEVLFGFPVDDGPLELTITPRADRATGRIRRESVSRYLTLDRVLEELEVEYEELAGLVADGKIRAFRVEDTTRFSKADVLALKQLKPTPTPEPTAAWLDLSLADALTALNLGEEELVRLVSEGEIRAFKDGDEIRFRRTDIDAHRNRHRRSYYSLPDALRRLGTTGRELARLVSEGQVRSFRDGDEMWFRKSDIDERAVPGGGDEHRFFTCEDVQRILGVAESELARMVADGELRAFRDGDEIRFPRADVGAMLAERAIRERITRPDDAPPSRAREDASDLDAVPGAVSAPADSAARRPAPAVSLDSGGAVPSAARDPIESTTLRQPLPVASGPSSPSIRAVDPTVSARESVEHPPHEAHGTTASPMPGPVATGVAETGAASAAMAVGPGASPATTPDSVPLGRASPAGGGKGAARPGPRAGSESTELASKGVPAPPPSSASVIELEARWLPPSVGCTSHVNVIVTPGVGGSEADGEVRLVVPGALIASAALGLAGGRAAGAIAIHPLVAGPLDARLEVWRAGTVAGSLALPLGVRPRPWLGPVALRLALVLPLAGLVLALVPASGAGGGGVAVRVDAWVRSVCGWELAGLAAGLGALAVAGVARAAASRATQVVRGPLTLSPLGSRVLAVTPRVSRTREDVPPAAETSWPGCVPAGATSTGFRAFRHVQTGIELVEIPAGAFWRGARDDDPLAQADERPCRRIELAAFLIGRVPVTVSQFRRFAALVPEWDERRAGSPEADEGYLKSWRRGLAQRAQPVTEVSWFAAEAFCAWAGLALPTEAQWEKAARGTRGSRFPWGDEWPTPEHARFADTHLAPVWDGGRYVGAHAAGASPYGVLEVAGNAEEWVADRYDPAGYAGGPDRDPTGPASGSLRVARGGSYQSPPEDLRATARHHRLPMTSDASLGFRVALGTSPASGSAPSADDARPPQA